MTSPELHVEAWLSAQDAFLSATSGNGSEPSEHAPAEAEQASAAEAPLPLPDNFWQDWFGIWT